MDIRFQFFLCEAYEFLELEVVPVTAADNRELVRELQLHHKSRLSDINRKDPKRSENQWSVLGF